MRPSFIIAYFILFLVHTWGVSLAFAFPWDSEGGDRKKIYIDAGHGGRDAGTFGYGGLEKEVVLLLAKKIRTVLWMNSSEKAEIKLSRVGDHFLSLRDRVKEANAWGADLFLSLHANFYKNSKPKGFEVYFYGDKASDPLAHRTALKENSVNKKDKMPVLRILNELKRSQQMQESSLLSEYLFESLKPNFKPNGKGVKQAPFYVLEGGEMPSVLVEIGYLSNDEEAKLLQKENYLNGLANAISKGIQRFLKIERREAPFPKAVAQRENSRSRNDKN